MQLQKNGAPLARLARCSEALREMVRRAPRAHLRRQSIALGPRPGYPARCCAVPAGRCSEAERDRIEEQVGAFVRTCTDNIARLEASVAAEPVLNAHVVAHRHGAVREPLCVKLHEFHYETLRLTQVAMLARGSPVHEESPSRPLGLC